MKKILFGALMSLIVLASCSKSDDPDPVNPSAEKYMSLTTGNSWNYSYTDNADPSNNYNYSVVSSNKDTVAAGKTYHVLTDSDGASEYYNITGSDYYSLQAFSLGVTDTIIDNLYLKDGAAVGESWGQSFSLDVGIGTPVQVNITNSIAEKGIAKTVGSTNYSNVIHVATTISVPMLATIPGSSLTTNIHYYYAPKVGLIQNDAKVDLVVPLLSIDDHTDVQTKLTSSIIL